MHAKNQCFVVFSNRVISLLQIYREFIKRFHRHRSYMCVQTQKHETPCIGLLTKVLDRLRGILSVCLSVTFLYFVQMNESTIVRSSASGKTIIIYL